MGESLMTANVSWLNDFNTALGQAAQWNKPLLIDWSDLPSCIGCISLENSTYPDRQVADYLNSHFIALQLNQSEHPLLFDDNRVIWTPTITIRDAPGVEQDRWTGYLPPQEFLPRVKLAQARMTLSAGDWSRAAELFHAITIMYPKSFVAAESYYWLGVARWKVSRNSGDLTAWWEKLIEEHPESEAALKASCLSSLKDPALSS
jgi:hypothetical protein